MINYLKIIGCVFVFISFSNCTQRIAAALPQKSTSLHIDYSGNLHYTYSNNIEEILDYAKKNDKIIFYEFYADWCLPCQVFEETVLQSRDMASYFNDHFINCKVDYDTELGKELAFLFQVTELPTVVFTDHAGVVLQRENQRMNLEYILDSAKRHVDQKKTSE